MRALGLDPSLRSYGWCVVNLDAPPGARRVASGHDGTLSSHVPVARYMHFRSVVHDLLRRFDVDVVGMESPAYDGGPFQMAHQCLMMFALEAVFGTRKDVVLFDPATLKAVSTGSSRASKLEMQVAVQKDNMDPTPMQSDEADAYLAARAAGRFLSVARGLAPPESLSDHERRTFLTRTKVRKTPLGGKRVVRTAYAFRENSRFFEFSRVPPGEIALPDKAAIRPELMEWVVASETDPEGGH
jgi:Holliday junction resolvasome RuvABC endonuclease subunit